MPPTKVYIEACTQLTLLWIGLIIDIDVTHVAQAWTGMACNRMRTDLHTSDLISGMQIAHLELCYFYLACKQSHTYPLCFF